MSDEIRQFVEEMTPKLEYLATPLSVLAFGNLPETPGEQEELNIQ